MKKILFIFTLVLSTHSFSMDLKNAGSKKKFGKQKKGLLKMADKMQSQLKKQMSQLQKKQKASKK